MNIDTKTLNPKELIKDWMLNNQKVIVVMQTGDEFIGHIIGKQKRKLILSGQNSDKIIIFKSNIAYIKEYY